MLRARVSLGKTFIAEETDLPTDSTRIHACSSCEVTHRQRLAVTQCPKDTHRLLGQGDASGTCHTGMHPATRQQAAEPVETEPNGTQLLLDR